MGDWDSQSQLGRSQEAAVSGGAFAFDDSDVDSDDDSPRDSLRDSLRRFPAPRSRNPLSGLAAPSSYFRLMAWQAHQVILVW